MENAVKNEEYPFFKMNSDVKVEDYPWFNLKPPKKAEDKDDGKGSKKDGEIQEKKHDKKGDLSEVENDDGDN